MKLIHLTVFLLLMLYVHGETTQLPDETTEDIFRSKIDNISENAEEKKMESLGTEEEEVAKPVQVSIALEDIPSQIVQPSPVSMLPVMQPAQPIRPAEQHFHPRAVPMHVPSMMGNAQGNMAQLLLSPYQRQVPPFFGNPFRPSIIRSLDSSVVALPPKDQATFDSLLCRQESNSKRDLEKRSPHSRHLEKFFLSMKNQDILFSICGNLMPAHLLVIESISEKFEKKISALKEKTNNEPIVINDLADLLAQSNANQTENNSTALPLDTSKCSNSDLVPAFRSFLKFFYIGGQAFDEIEEIDVAFIVWKLGAELLDMDTVQQQIEPRIGTLISPDNLSKVYQFIKANKVDSLQKRWSEFITSNSRTLVESNKLLLSCEQINGDIEYLDRFIEALNVNQSMAIGYIRQYLRICPESASFAPEAGENPFPRSLIFFRCTIEDLKELVKMGFINYETLSEEFENRLRARDRYCDEKCASAKFVPLANPAFRHVVPLNSGASFGGRRA